jgi:hypothetical protein
MSSLVSSISQRVAPENIKSEISNTEDFVNGVSSGTLGQVLIRCNNVLWIGKAEEVKAHPGSTGTTSHEHEGQRGPRR